MEHGIRLKTDEELHSLLIKAQYRRGGTLTATATAIKRERHRRLEGREQVHEPSPTISA